MSPEKTKVKKVKSDKKRIECGFRFEEHHFEREFDREGRENGDQRREICFEWEICNERVNKVEEKKERKKEGTYVKRAMWWRDKISYGRLLHLSSKSTVVLR